jgi:hypothetical protein
MRFYFSWCCWLEPGIKKKINKFMQHMNAAPGKREFVQVPHAGV